MTALMVLSAAPRAAAEQTGRSSRAIIVSAGEGPRRVAGATMYRSSTERRPDMTRMIAVTLLMLFATTRESSSVAGSLQGATTFGLGAPIVRVYPSDTPGLIAPVAIQTPGPHDTRE